MNIRAPRDLKLAQVAAALFDKPKAPAVLTVVPHKTKAGK